MKKRPRNTVFLLSKQIRRTSLQVTQEKSEISLFESRNQLPNRMRACGANLLSFIFEDKGINYFLFRLAYWMCVCPKCEI